MTMEVINGVDYFRSVRDGYECYCCVCDQWTRGSPYLISILPDPRVLLLGNLVVHYRHEHLTQYDNGKRHRSDEAQDAFRSEINERAKRQLARKGSVWFKAHGFTAEDARGLFGTTIKTANVWEKCVGMAPE